MTTVPAEEELRGGLRLDLSHLRDDVQALSVMERASAADHEPQVAWLEDRLRQAGAHEVHREGFRFQRRLIWRYGAHAAAGLAAAAVGGPAGAGLALATLGSLELEISGRSSWLGRFLPAGHGTNVVARVPAAGLAERTIVFVVHHDAQRPGLLWRLPRSALPVAAPGQLVLALIAFAALIGSRLLRALGALGLSLLTLLGLEASRNRVVPGANDNASGVAALLALVAACARDPLERTDLVAVFTDCEEVGLGGSAAWVAAHCAELDAAATLVVSLDTLGSGEPAVVCRDGAMTARYAAQAQDWADRGALRAAVAPPRRVHNVAPTDGLPALHAGLHTLSLVSCAPDGTLGPHYHQPSDTPEHVDWDSVERCTRLAGGVARVWDAAS